MTDSVLELQRTLLSILTPLSSGGQTLRSYGIDSFAIYMVVILLPVTLYILLDHLTKPVRK